ncbi:hypothetical protein PENANT_c221G05672, partial [Penicillium antarcticum]
MPPGQLERPSVLPRPEATSPNDQTRASAATLRHPDGCPGAA